ncbi:Murinoglobulin-1, partial [Gryllus bimaculatus]
MRERGERPPPPPPPGMSPWLTLLVLLAGALTATEADRGFLIAAPKRMLAGSTERVCLAFFNVSGPAHVQLHVLRADSDERLAAASHRVLAEEAACVPLAVPAAPAAQPPPARARLLVQARFDHAYDYVVSAVREVRVQAQPLLVFVQTDRAAYRPGQRVRVRVLTLRHDLTPADGAVAAAWLLSPAEVRLAQWTRPKSQLGLGTWTVRVRLDDDATEHSASFAVREYVLPRFTVTIEGPRYVLADAAHVAWRVCARYTHGEPVRGRVAARAEPRVPAWRAAGARQGSATDAAINGCFSFNVSAALLGLRDWDTSPSAVRLYAELCLKARRRREWSRSLVQCRNFSSGADGVLHFRVPPQGPDVQLLSLVATAVDFPTKYYAPGTRWRVLMDQPSAFFDVHAWFSPSKHFLEVVDDDPAGPRCGAPHDFSVYYTGSTPLQLRYLVTARGDIVQAGVAPVQELPAAAEAQHPHSLGDAGAPAPRRFLLSLKVSARMAPAAALLVYQAGLPGGEVAAASLALRPPHCFANPVSPPVFPHT